MCNFKVEYSELLLDAMLNAKQFYDKARTLGLRPSEARSEVLPVWWNDIMFEDEELSSYANSKLNEWEIKSAIL